jgi:ankyrin repeat protein
MFSFIKKIFKGTLHKACDKGNIEAVKQHLADGADVNAKNWEGVSPLHYAALTGRKETAELLISEGADVNARGTDDETPLGAAEYVDENYHSPEDKAALKETAELLRKHGGKTGEELKAEV